MNTKVPEGSVLARLLLPTLAEAMTGYPSTLDPREVGPNDHYVSMSALETTPPRCRGERDGVLPAKAPTITRGTAKQNPRPNASRDPTVAGVETGTKGRES